MAGLWEYWKPKDDPEGEYPDGLVTATVLTTEAVGPLAQVHDRMPLVLPPSAWDAWLDPDAGSRRRGGGRAARPAVAGAGRGAGDAAGRRRGEQRAQQRAGAAGPAGARRRCAEPLQLDLLAGPNPQ